MFEGSLIGQQKKQSFAFKKVDAIDSVANNK